MSDSAIIVIVIIIIIIFFTNTGYSSGGGCNIKIKRPGWENRRPPHPKGQGRLKRKENND